MFAVEGINGSNPKRGRLSEAIIHAVQNLSRGGWRKNEKSPKDPS